MHILPILLIFVIVPGAIHSCDPQTQYKDGSNCCKKCGPGTRMSIATCDDPQCTACGENEYQDGYTQNSKCERQKYCDPNLNFDFASHESKTHKTTCLCKTGFYCSSKECLTCVSHSTCKPGERIQYQGNHTHDTVCQKCSAGTFSSGSSEDGDCKSWTVCGPGLQVLTTGTATSDTICGKGQRQRIINIVVVVTVVLILAILGFIVYRCKGNSQEVKHKVKDCVRNIYNGPLTEIGPFTPVEDSVEVKMVDRRDSMVEDRPRDGAMTPEESDYPNEPILTDNGNVIAQEDGKREALSRQESHSLITLEESVPHHTHGHGV